LIVGKDMKNLTDKDDPLDYLLGVTVGNDVSSRYWQAAPRSGGQHGPAKAFDKFAPIGPVIVSIKTIGNPENLKLRTWVNGDLRQETMTNDLIFGIEAILRHISRGTTIKKGTAIMTGTPR
jgi:2-keto-4-pentenoate hydratase/2-oxohepta-3-ene-1,7-dioic acid hydratase in catechol pathway